MYRRHMCVFALALSFLVAGSAVAQVGQGKVLFEYWEGIGGTNVNNDLKSNANYPNSPSWAEWRNGLKSQPDRADNYGVRARAYLTPPADGDYTFWVSGDDNTELWLSTDDTAANAVRIAQVLGWTGVEQWDKADEAGQKSAPVTLVGGQKYYIEMLMKEGGGGDSATAGWAGPTIGDAPTVITGDVLTAFIRDPEPLFAANRPVPSNGNPDWMPDYMFLCVPGLFADNVLWHLGTAADALAAQGPMFPAGDGTWMGFAVELTAGATYYWRADTVTAAGVVEGPVWSVTIRPLEAHFPTPFDGRPFARADQKLSWVAGQNAVTHNVYFGTDPNLVAARDASVANMGVIENSFDPPDLVADTTYYWCVDEDDGFGAIAPGPVWSFTSFSSTGGALAQYWNNTSHSGAPAVVTTVPEIAWNWGDGGTKGVNSPHANINTNNFSCRWTAELFVPVTGTYKLYGRTDDGCRIYLDGVRLTDQWVGRGIPGEPGDTSPDLQLTAGTKYVVTMEQYEGSGGTGAYWAWSGPGIPYEVIPPGILQIPTGAVVLTPGNTATNVAQTPVLSWIPGVGAVEQKVYLAPYTKKGDVDGSKDAALLGATADNSIAVTTPLVWGMQYYWKVDSVQADGTTVAGSVWSFTVADYLEIGSTQQTLWYNNIADPFFSELAYDTLADWTVNGTEALSLRFQGAAAPPETQGSTTIDGPGAYTLVGSGSDIWGTADQFQFAYMPLTGDASIVAKVVSVENKNVWAKGGVMIRQSVNANAAYGIVALTGGGATTGGGIGFQYRTAAGAEAGAGADGPGISAPYFVRLDRVGNTFTAFMSPDGQEGTWTQLNTPVEIPMADPVLIGLAYTSHAGATTFGTGVFTDVSVVGAVDAAAAANGDVGLGNTPQPVYVVVEDATGAAAVAVYPDPAATNLTSWMPWRIPLGDLAGIDLTQVAKLYVGVGDSLNPTADGTGRINIDSVRVVKPFSPLDTVNVVKLEGQPPIISSVVRANGAKGTRTDGSPINGAFVENTAPVAMQEGGLIDGNYVFSDRNYPWASVPAVFQGAEYVLTYNSDKSGSETDVTYTVTTSRTALVFITADNRVAFPKALDGWDEPASLQAAVDITTGMPGVFHDTGLDIMVREDKAPSTNATKDRRMSIFAAVLPAGTYTFVRQNSDKNFYTIGAVDISEVVLGFPANGNWPAGERPPLAFDGLSATKFLHFNGALEATGVQVMPAGGPSVVTGLAFTTANDWANRDPVKFELYGSNDSISGPWTLIAAGDIVDFAGATEWPRLTPNATPIAFPNATAYTYYQLIFPAYRGTGQSCMQIAEIELIAAQ